MARHPAELADTQPAVGLEEAIQPDAHLVAPLELEQALVARPLVLRHGRRDL
jgi:hypothetical protein